jgi:hypothetical protein
VHAAPEQIETLQSKWKLDPVIHLQHYQKLKPAAQAA